MPGGEKRIKETTNSTQSRLPFTCRKTAKKSFNPDPVHRIFIIWRPGNSVSHLISDDDLFEFLFMLRVHVVQAILQMSISVWVARLLFKTILWRHQNL